MKGSCLGGVPVPVWVHFADEQNLAASLKAGDRMLAVPQPCGRGLTLATVPIGKVPTLAH